MTKDEVTRALALLSRRAATWTHELTCIDERKPDERMPADRLRRINDDLSSALSPITLSVTAG